VSAARRTERPRVKDFQTLGLADPIAKALAAKGYQTPTPIQTQAIPPALEGRDLLGVAQTGTGKTAAFALPLLDKLSRAGGVPPAKAARVLVLAPTRELAGQIAASFRTYGGFTRISVSTVYGGAPINRQIRDMARGVDVLVATPGRLIDLIERRAVTLSHVEALVLDEADQMLDLGFVHALRRILPLLPAKRQTLLFSATMPKSIADLASSYLSDPVRVSVAPQATTAERIAQSAIHVSAADKPALLAAALRDPAIDRALVFTRTKHGADKVVKKLEQSGISAAAIHGNKKQTHRERTLAAFRSGACRVLVATDIAARGVDVPGVSHVVNYEIPNVPEQYVHRIGRTARAGAEGRAVSFVSREERAYLRDIEKTIRMAVPLEAPPEGFTATEPQPPADAPRAEVKRAGPRRRPRNRGRSGAPAAKAASGGGR
jgi:ATP-dependent RNA helicase RhlE